MLAIMTTIYDVLRLLVAKARPVLADAEIALAHKIINDHEEAYPVTLVPDEGVPGAEAK